MYGRFILGISLCMMVAIGLLNMLKPPADKYYDSANTKHAKRDYEGAINDYNAAISLKPNYAQAYCDRGDSKWCRGDYEGAIKDCSDAIRLDPKIPEAYLCRANAFEILGRHDLAIGDFTKVIELKPDSATAYNYRASAKAALGQIASATQDYSAAIAIDPKYADAYKSRATMNWIRGDYPAALADADTALKFNSFMKEAYDLRGRIENMQGHFKQSVQDFDEAIKLGTDETTHTRFIRDLTVLRINLPSAKTAPSELVNRWKDSPSKRIGLYLSGQMTETEILLEAERSEKKDVPKRQCEAYYYIGMVHLIKKETAAANYFFQKCFDTEQKEMLEYRLAFPEIERLEILERLNHSPRLN